jgi:hypothetical protein
MVVCTPLVWPFVPFVEGTWTSSPFSGKASLGHILKMMVMKGKEFVCTLFFFLARVIMYVFRLAFESVLYRPTGRT